MKFRAMFIAGLALAATAPAIARTGVSFDSAVFVERGNAASGRMLEPANRLNRGDRVVYILDWQSTGGSAGFFVTNPLPRAVAYQQSANGDEQISADGGRTWGKLGTLRLGTRLVTPEDVTHVRWRVDPARAALGSGRIAYSAIVR